MLFPLYSILRQNEGGFARPAAQVVMLHLKRVHLMEWVRAVMAVALGAAPGAPLPPLIMQREQDDLWSQPSAAPAVPCRPSSRRCDALHKQRFSRFMTPLGALQIQALLQ